MARFRKTQLDEHSSLWSHELSPEWPGTATSSHSSIYEETTQGGDDNVTSGKSSVPSNVEAFPILDSAQAATAAFPNGVSSGDVTQTSVVLWTRAVETGQLTFQIATDESFSDLVRVKHVAVTDPSVPVKLEFDHLKPGQDYFYKVIDADGHVLEGSFETAAALGTHAGFNFGVGGDTIGGLAPYVSLKNAATAGLDLFLKFGDVVYSDTAYVDGIPVPTSTTTLEEYRLLYDSVYGTHDGFNGWADLQATTPILSVIDDGDVRNDFAGGAPPSTDLRFDQSGDFINETQLFANGLQVFNEYNAIENRTYNGTGEDRFDGAPDLYRYNTYGSDAAIILLDARTFRDTEVPVPANPLNPVQASQFLSASFDPTRTMLGDVQLERLEQDLLDARDKGITWKFVMLPEPIQNLGPIIGAGDRYEGYAAERDALLKFIDDNHIENVVFVSSDSHLMSVNNLTYQDSLGGPQIASSAFEVDTPAIASIPTGPFIPQGAADLGLPGAAALLALYNLVPNAPDLDSVLNDKDDIVKFILDTIISHFGYDPIGLNHNLPQANGLINATLLQGDYFVAHSFGWTDFNIDAASQDLLVTTYGIPYYTNPADVPNLLSLNPQVVSQFKVTPTSDSIIGTADRDNLVGTADSDVLLGAAGNDVLKGGSGDDYLDGGKDQDVVYGGDGNDHIFGRDGNDRLYGDGGNDQIDGGLGQDTLTGGAGNDTFAFTTALDGLPNVDRIADYTVADDTIRLENSVFTALTAAGTLSAANFVVGAAAADADDFIIYNDQTGALYYDADGNGGGAKVMFASLSHGLALTHSDFFVV